MDNCEHDPVYATRLFVHDNGQPFRLWVCKKCGAHGSTNVPPPEEPKEPEKTVSEKEVRTASNFRQVAHDYLSLLCDFADETKQKLAKTKSTSIAAEQNIMFQLSQAHLRFGMIWDTLDDDMIRPVAVND